MKRTQEINELSGRDRDRIATVLYCHQFMAKDHKQPTMAAEMVFAQLAGYKLSTVLHIAEIESLDMTGSELDKFFKK